MYDVILHPPAKRDLDRVPQQVFQRLYDALRALGDNPRPVGVQKLEGTLHRIRVEDWRIVYGISDKERRVIVVRIARRSEKTYRNLS